MTKRKEKIVEVITVMLKEKKGAFYANKFPKNNF